jgi:predicted outer membrane repeat protein
LNDSGAGSLRASLPDHYFGDIITLDQSLGSLMTVASALSLTKDIQIVGPGAGLLTITGNDSTRVIDITFADVVLSGLTITGGSDSGVHISGKTSSHGVLTLIYCTVNGNSGSGVLSQSFTDIRVYNSSFFNNQALGSGGAISSGGTLAITNSTFTGNSAGNGAAIFSSAQTDIRYSTISGNTAGSNGGGIYHSSGLFSVTDTIVAGNSAPSSGPDILSGPAITSSYNLIGDGAGATGVADGVNHDQVGTTAAPKDPKLDPNGLQNHGGPTATIALLITSPAIDAGDPANIPARDQRAFGRLGVSDIGAFEFGGAAFQITSIVRSGSNINITFPAVPGEIYRLQRKGLLTDAAWQTILDGLTVFFPTPEQVTDVNGANLGHASYRVVAVDL